MFIMISTLNGLRKHQADIPSLIHDRSPTEGTIHLSGKLILLGTIRGGIERQAFSPLRKSEIRFLKDGRPLERRAYTVSMFQPPGRLPRK